MADPISEILQFATTGTEEDGDVMSLEDYTAASARLKGHQAGIASRALANMQARQSSHMAAGLAQFIANRYAAGVVDDGDLAKVEAGLAAAIQALIEDAVEDYEPVDANILRSNVHKVRTQAHPGTCVALTDAATVSPDLTAGDAFSWALGANRTLGDVTMPGAGKWPILLSGEYTLSVNAAWTVDNDDVDPGTGTRVVWMYSLDGTEKRLRFEER